MQHEQGDPKAPIVDRCKYMLPEEPLGKDDLPDDMRRALRAAVGEERGRRLLADGELPNAVSLQSRITRRSRLARQRIKPVVDPSAA